MVTRLSPEQVMVGPQLHRGLKFTDESQSWGAPGPQLASISMTAPQSNALSVGRHS